MSDSSSAAADPPPLLSDEQALRFLARASDALTASLDYETTLTTLARLMVPALADWCVVDLADGDRGLRRLAVTHTDPAREAWAWELARKYPPDPAAESGILHVFRTGRPEVVSHIPRELIVSSARGPEHHRLLEELGLESYLAVPLRARERTLGVLTLVTGRESGRRYGRADLALLEEVARRAAIAVDNAMLHRAEQEARAAAEAAAERAERLATASAEFASVYTLADAAAAITRLSRSALTADAGALFLLSKDGATLELAHNEGYAPAAMTRFGRIAVGDRLAVAEAVRERRAVVVGGPADRADRYPETLEVSAHLPTGGLIAQPLLVRGDLVGVLVLSYDQPREFSAPERSFLESLAAQCAQAVARARLYENEREAAGALRASESRLRSVVESGMIGIAFWDGAKVVDANQAFLDMLGYSREDVAAGEVRHGRLSPPEYQEADRQATVQVQTHGTCVPYEKEFFRKDGSRVPVLAGGSMLPGGEQVVFFVLDLTQQKEVREQLQTAQRMEAVGQLAGGVAHEINNALQGVIGFLSFALSELPADAPARRDVEEARQAGERAGAITRQLLAFSRRQLMRPTTLDLTQVVNDFAPMLRQALGPEHELLLVPGAEPAWGHADRGQIEQVLLNIALNARDAMQPGGRLTIRSRVVTLKAERLRAKSAPPSLRPGRYVELTLGDTGHGIPPELQPRIFEPFFTTKEPGKGTGLGLSVVHGIVQQSGGHIWFYSEPGLGTTFRIILPEAAAPDAPGPRPGPVGEPAEGREEVVLVADDEPMILEVAGRILRSSGYSVLEARNGREALEQLETAQIRGRPVSLVIADVVMPVMNGRELAREVERRTRDGRLPATRILHTSGYTDDEVIRRGLLERSAAFIQKPFDPEALAERVRRLLDGNPISGGQAGPTGVAD